MNRQDKVRRVMLAAAIITALGTVMTWASASALWVTYNVTGFESEWGKAVLVLAVVGAAFAWFVPSAPRAMLAVVPAAVLGTCAWFIQHTLAIHTPGEIAVHVTVGVGVYVTIAAAVVWLVAALAAQPVAVTTPQEARA